MTGNRALVTGASGLLGRSVVKAFKDGGWDTIGTGFSRADGKTLIKVDLENASEIEKALDEIKPNVVVHCAANRFPDKVDKDPEGTRKLNIDASRSLAELCAARDAVLIYISTDYVFPGKAGEAPYAATATPSPPNLYGETKLDGEKAVLDVYAKAQTKGRAVVLRVPVLYGPADKNADSAVNILVDIVNKVQTPGVTVKMDHWSIRYPTNTEDVGRVCKDIGAKYGETDAATTLPPVLQFSSEDRYTKYGICQVFAEILGVPLTNMEADPLGGNVPGAVQRPYDCHLSTQALKDLGISVYTQDFVGWWRREFKAFRH